MARRQRYCANDAPSKSRKKMRFCTVRQKGLLPSVLVKKWWFLVLRWFLSASWWNSCTHGFRTAKMLNSWEIKLVRDLHQSFSYILIYILSRGIFFGFCLVFAKRLCVPIESGIFWYFEILVGLVTWRWCEICLRRVQGSYFQISNRLRASGLAKWLKLWYEIAANS